MKFGRLWDEDASTLKAPPPPGLRLPPLNGPAWREYLLLALVLTAVFLYCFKPLQDPDTFWHLAVGRAIWHSGHLLTKETFSYTVPGAPWVDEEWLFHVIAYPMWRLGGDMLLRVFTAACGVLAVGFLYRSVRILGGNASGLAILFLPLISVYAERFRFRPEIFSLALMVILLEILFRWKEAPSGWKRRLPWLLLLFWLWIQLHGGWAYGMLLLGAFLFGAVMDAARERRFSSRMLFQAAGTAAAVWAVLFINPLGWRLPLFPVHHLISLWRGEHYVPIAEWMRTPFAGDYRYFYGLVFLAILAVLVTPGRFRWKDFAIVSSQSFLGFYWVRYAAYAVLGVIPPTLSRLLDLKKPSWLKRTALAGAFLGAGFAVYLGATRPSGYPPMDEGYPVMEAAFLREHHIHGNLFHEFRAGGYLEWALAPQCKVFLDGRYGPFNKVGMEFYNAHRTLKSFEALLARYPSDIVVYPYQDYRLRTARNTPPRGITAVLFPQQEWSLVYMGDYGMVLLKRIPDFEPIIRRYGYSVLRPGDLPYLVWSVERGTIPRQNLASDLHRALSGPMPKYLRVQIKKALALIEPPQGPGASPGK